MLRRLRRYAQCDLFEPPINEVGVYVREAMFRECSFRGWNREDIGARFTQEIIRTWEYRRLPHYSLTRWTTSWYYQFRSGITHLREFRSTFAGGGDSCRFGCAEQETVRHILLECRQ